MRFEVYNSQPNALSGMLGSGQTWRWRLRSGNSEIMASGEGYATKYNAERAVASIKSQINTADVIEVAR